MKIIISINDWKSEDRKHIVNSIKGFAKALAKRMGFVMTFEVGE